MQTYLADFNPGLRPPPRTGDAAHVGHHSSGIAGDFSLDGPWGPVKPDKAEGIRRALAAWVVFGPGELFHYSDITIIILGALVEKITGEPLDILDIYAQDNVFTPLRMDDTHYLPAVKAFGPQQIRGTAIALDPSAPEISECPPATRDTNVLARVAPTVLDEDTPGMNPDYCQPLRYRARPDRAPHGWSRRKAGVFTTAHDVGRAAQVVCHERGLEPRSRSS